MSTSWDRWGRVTHIFVGNLAIIGSDNGLSHGRRQAIIWNNAGILLIGPLGTNFSEILIDIYTFSFRKTHLKMPSGTWRPFCLGLSVSIDAILCILSNFHHWFRQWLICSKRLPELLMIRYKLKREDFDSLKFKSKYTKFPVRIFVAGYHYRQSELMLETVCYLTWICMEWNDPRHSKVLFNKGQYQHLLHITLNALYHVYGGIKFPSQSETSPMKFSCRCSCISFSRYHIVFYSVTKSLFLNSSGVPSTVQL